MAVSWPFDSTLTQDEQGNPVYSRVYSADVIARILARYFRNGVFGDDGACFQVTANGNMTVTVQPGFANINGRQVYEESERLLSVQAADASLPRIDSVVLRLDLSLSALNIDLYVVRGEAAASPIAPTLTRNASVYELGLANLFLPAAAATVTQDRITDTRLDGDRCGVVASLIGDTDTSAYYAQIATDLAYFKADREATFDAWFAAIRGALETDAAGNLYTLVERYRAKRAQVTLAASGWTAADGGYTQTVAASVVPENAVLHAGPLEASREAYYAADVHVSAASAGSVTFTAASLPAQGLTAVIAVSEVA